jgi:hypothetical protein
LSDPVAEFSYGESWQVFHSRCGKWLAMTEAYNSTRFRQHIKGCKKMGSGSKFTTLNSFVVKGPARRIEAKKVEALVPPRMVDYPCLGITASLDERVPKFITRTGADGGGARSVTKIADELFNKAYSELSERKKSQVDTAQMHEWSFRFDRLHMAIHSSKCKKVVAAPEVDDGPHTCRECLDMHNSDPRLKSGLQKPMPWPDWSGHHLQRPHGWRSLPTSSLAPFHGGVRAHLWRMSKADKGLHVPRFHLHDPEVDGSDSRCCQFWVCR